MARTEARTEDVNATKGFLTNAVSIWRREEAGETITPEELKSVNDKTYSVQTEQWKDFRVVVGTLAMRGELVFDGKDAGPAIMRILFGEYDAKLFKSVALLSRALNVNLRDYTVSGMQNIYNTLEESGKKDPGKKLEKRAEEIGSSADDFRAARRELRNFLLFRAGVNIQEQIIMQEEAERERVLLGELEREFLSKRSMEQLEKLVDLRKDALQYLWDEFRQARFEEAPQLAVQIKNARDLLEEIKSEFSERKKELKKKDKTEISESEPEESRVRALALIRMAKREIEDAESLRDSDEIQKLETKARGHELEAEQYLEMGNSSGTGAGK